MIKRKVGYSSEYGGWVILSKFIFGNWKLVKDKEVYEDSIYRRYPTVYATKEEAELFC